VQPPLAMDGIPAPDSAVTPPHVAEESRAAARALLEHEWLAASGPSAASRLWSPTMRFYGPSGFGFAQSRSEYEAHFLAPLTSAFTKRSFELDVLTCEGAYCGAHGHLHATHSGCFLGERATGLRVSLRVGMHWHIVDGIATEGYAIFDTPALFQQFGVAILNRTGAIPPPCPVKKVLSNQLIELSSAPIPACYVPLTFLAGIAVALAFTRVSRPRARGSAGSLGESLLPG